MNAEKYLQTVRTLKFKIDKSADEAIKQIKEKDQLEEAAIKMMEKLRGIDMKLSRLRSEYIDRRIKAYDRIMKIEEGQCRRFLIDYYIDCKSIKDIRTEYGYSEESGVYQLKKRSIKKFQKND